MVLFGVVSVAAKVELVKVYSRWDSYHLRKCSRVLLSCSALFCVAGVTRFLKCVHEYVSRNVRPACNALYASSIV